MTTRTDTDMTEVASGLTRRNFLAGGGAILGAALLLGPNGVPRPGALGRLSQAAGPRLSLGYVEGSAGLGPLEVRELLAAPRTRVVSAASLRRTPRSFTGKSVTMRVGSLTPGGGSTAAHLDVLVAPPRGAGHEPLPFYAWTMTAGGTSGSAQFVVPVVAEPTLGLSLRRFSAAEPTEAVAVFTGGRDRELPKLHPGLYLIGFEPDQWRASRTFVGEHDPAWASMTSLALSVHDA